MTTKRAASQRELPPAPSSDKEGEQEKRGSSSNLTDFSTEDILAAIRKVFTAAGELAGEEAIKVVARELGIQRVRERARQEIRTGLNAASRRGIIYNNRGTYYLDCRTINDYPDELLEKAFHAVIGRTWWEREEAITAAARYLGFRRAGSQIKAAFEKVIRREIRRGELERDGGWVRRT